LKEDLGAESEGSTKTITETITGILAEAPLPPRCFPGELFMISYDSPLGIGKPIPSTPSEKEGTPTTLGVAGK
jgi:hypothetical protein